MDETRRSKRLAVALAVLLAGAALFSGRGLAYDFVRGSTHRSAADTIPSQAVHFGAGRDAKSFQLREPAGVILLYRVSVPIGMKLRGSVQLPDVTVPLRIATSAPGPDSPCVIQGTRLVCTQGEEWCPMPPVWTFQLEKLAGREGDVTLSFRVGNPPGKA